MPEDTNNNSPLVFTLDSSLTIDNMVSLSAELRQMLESGSTGTGVIIDASKVEVITTPGAQIIVSLGKLMERNNASLTITSPTEVFAKAFQMLGLENLLSKWVVTHE